MQVEFCSQIISEANNGIKMVTLLKPFVLEIYRLEEVFFTATPQTQETVLKVTSANMFSVADVLILPDNMSTLII